jgi:molecular chaperone GrpE
MIKIEVFMDKPNEHNDLNAEAAHEEQAAEQKSVEQQKITELEATIASLKSQLQQAQERSQYLTADLENVRRRAERESQIRIDAAQAALLGELIVLVDDFERAFENLQTKPELVPFVAGFELTYKALVKLLNNHHITVIEVSPGTHFDPELHEAVMQSDDPEKKSGDIVAVLQKGYRYKGVVIRPAKVSVKA